MNKKIVCFQKEKEKMYIHFFFVQSQNAQT